MIYFECLAPSVLLKPNEQFYKDNLSLYSVIAWLKSDVFIWTCLQKESDVNIFSPKLLLNCCIPYIKEYYSDIQIENKVNEILSLEQKFLKEVPIPIDSDDIEAYETASEKCKEHNDLVSQKATEKERIIKTHFNIEANEDEMIKNDLFDERIYTPDEELSDIKELSLECL